MINVNKLNDSTAAALKNINMVERLVVNIHAPNTILVDVTCVGKKNCSDWPLQSNPENNGLHLVDGLSPRPYSLTHLVG